MNEVSLCTHYVRIKGVATSFQVDNVVMVPPKTRMRRRCQVQNHEQVSLSVPIYMYLFIHIPMYLLYNDIFLIQI